MMAKLMFKVTTRDDPKGVPFMDFLDGRAVALGYKSAAVERVVALLTLWPSLVEDKGEDQLPPTRAEVARSMRSRGWSHAKTYRVFSEFHEFFPGQATPDRVLEELEASEPFERMTFLKVRVRPTRA